MQKDKRVILWDDESRGKRREYKLRYKMKHPERAYLQEHNYYLANRDRLRVIRNIWAKNHPEKCRGYEKRKRERFPDRLAARSAVASAVKSGRLKMQPCVLCGVLPSHAHHGDYRKPLQVVWLCPQHHRERHPFVINPLKLGRNVPNLSRGMSFDGLGCS